MLRSFHCVSRMTFRSQHRILSNFSRAQARFSSQTRSATSNPRQKWLATASLEELQLYDYTTADFQTAFTYFQGLENPTAECYQMMIEFAAKEDFASALALLDESHEKDFFIPRYCFNIILRDLKETKQHDNFWSWFSKMNETGYTDALSYDLAVRLAFELNYVDTPFSLFDHAKTIGIKIDRALLTTMASIAEKVDRPDLRKSYEDELRANHRLDGQHYYSLINSKLRSHSFPEAKEIAREALERGNFLGPAQINVLLSAFQRSPEELEVAWALFEKKGIVRNELSFILYFKGLSSIAELPLFQSKLDQTLQFFYQTDRKITPKVLATLLSIHAKRGMWEKAGQFAQLVTQEKMHLDHFLLSSLLRVYHHNRNWKEGIEMIHLFQEMESRKEDEVLKSQIEHFMQSIPQKKENKATE